jgi:hypothetical protein
MVWRHRRSYPDGEMGMPIMAEVDFLMGLKRISNIEDIEN